MSEPSILVVHPKSIAPKDKRALKDAGIIVIEADDPASVRFLKPNAELDGSELLLCAMRAIASQSIYTKVKIDLVDNIMTALEQKAATLPSGERI